MMMKVFSPLPTVMDEGRYAVTKNEAEKYMFKKEINMGDPIGLFCSIHCLFGAKRLTTSGSNRRPSGAPHPQRVMRGLK
jgi:hypothetical protein